jgi:hypothetical protein
LYRLVFFQVLLKEHHKTASNNLFQLLHDLHPRDKDKQEVGEAEAGKKKQVIAIITDKILYVCRETKFALTYHVFCWSYEFDGSIFNFRATSGITITIAHWIVLELIRH